MRKIIVFINELAINSVIFSLIFLIQKFTLGKIAYFKDMTIFNLFYLHEIIFICISLFITIYFFKTESNYRIGGN